MSNIFKSVAEVRVAQQNMEAAWREAQVPAISLLKHVYEHPLSTVGVAAGTGFLLGQLNTRPLHIPGLGSLLGSGMAELMTQAATLAANLGI